MDRGGRLDTSLEGEAERRMIITHVVDLLLGALQPVVPLASVASGILAAQEQVQDGGGDGAQPHHGEGHAVAGRVLGALPREEDVGGDDAGDVTQGNLEPAAEGALPVARHVVGHPGQSDGRRHVPTEADEEDGRVFGIAAETGLAEQDSESDGRNQGADHNPDIALAHAVRGPRGEEHAGGRDDIDGDGANLSGLGSPAELVQDGGHEVRGSVTGGSDTHVDQRAVIKGDQSDVTNRSPKVTITARKKIKEIGKHTRARSCSR